MRLLPFHYAVRNLARSPLRLAATVSASVLVVLIVLGAAAFVRGMHRSLTLDTGNRNVILLGIGSEESIERSQVSSAAPGQIEMGIPGIKRRLGEGAVSPEVHVALFVRRDREDPRELRALLRGITPRAFLVHSRVRIARGRPPRAGQNELLAGSLVAERLGVAPDEVAIGRSLWFEGQAWTVVGHFEAPGTVMEGELWTALTDLQVATRRDSVSCIIVSLDEGQLADVQAWAAARLDLELSAVGEAAYYDALRRFYRPVRVMIWTTAVLVALAGILGGLNTLYAAFAARSRELAMLQTLGYPRYSLLVSLVQECVLATSAGALLAAGGGRLLLHGRAVMFSMGVFALHVDASVVALGLGTGLLVGLLGALPPAFKCLRQPVASSLKST